MPYPGLTLIGLDEEGCRSPAVAGAKAARLARARAAGLPVLPGFVVPVAAGTDALARGLAQLERAGRHAGQLEVMTAGTSQLQAEPLASELRDRAAALGSSVVVRSSSALEGDLRWAGAFTSYLGVAPEHAGVAVAGCWASALGRDALGRCEELGLPPGDLALAVLVQPELHPDLAGTATVEPGGAVRVVGVRGSPAQLMSGWDPATVRTVPPGAAPLDGTGTTSTDGTGTSSARDGIDTETLYAVAALVRAVHATLGDDTIEWALHAGRVVLLQAGATHPEQPRPRPRPPAGARRRRRASLPPESLSLARLAHRFGGPTGDAVVLPWAVAFPEQTAAMPPGPDSEGGGGDALGAWVRAQELAAELTATAWRTRPDRARERAAVTLAALRTGHTTSARRALHRLTKLAEVDVERGRLALTLLRSVAASLARRGVLASPEEFWSLPPEQVTAACEGSDRTAARPVPATRVAGAWEPFVHAAVLTHGSRAEGVPAAPGTAAGTAKLIGDDTAIGETSGRTVWVTSRPLPQFAPVLWHAAALVTAGGSPAAHLVQVARSLHVPAVVSCDLTPLGLEDGSRLLAVDGDEGVVAALSLG